MVDERRYYGCGEMEDVDDIALQQYTYEGYCCCSCCCCCGCYLEDTILRCNCCIPQQVLPITLLPSPLHLFRPTVSSLLRRLPPLHLDLIAQLRRPLVARVCAPLNTACCRR